MSMQHDPTEAPEFEAVVRRLAQRAERLQVRPGLCDRVADAVEREIDSSMVLASIGPAPWRRSLAIAAGVLLACSVVSTMVLRGNGRVVDAPRTTETLVFADGSHAERVLIALMGSTSDSVPSDGAAIIEELLPGCNVRLDELDLEMRELMGEPQPAREDSRS